MKLIIGLGNPGKAYENTRHNAGVMLVDRIEEILKQVQDDQKARYKTLKLKTFMNDSGVEVRELMNYYKLSPKDIIIAHDDLDIPLGSFKIQHAKGPHGHNGILSVERELKSDDFLRIRIGIENRDKENKVAGVEYTLQNFNTEEREKLNTVFEEIAQALTGTVRD